MGEGVVVKLHLKDRAMADGVVIAENCTTKYSGTLIIAWNSQGTNWLSNLTLSKILRISTLLNNCLIILLY
jgi:hypothetical protein